MADIHETNAAAQNLHDQIMRLSCNPPDYMNADLRYAHREGHRVARHAAAELAAAHEAEQAAPVAKVTAEISRDLLGQIVDEVFDGAIEDATVIEDIYRVIAREFSKRATPVAVPDGWKPVPITPTEAMVKASDFVSRRSAFDTWERMLSAAPTPPAQPVAVRPIDLKCLCTSFYYWWHNQPGTNTGEGFDEWFENGGRALLAQSQSEYPSTPPAQQSQWVSVSDRLPEIDTPVFLYEPNFGIWIGGCADVDDGWMWAHAQGTQWFTDGKWKADLFIDDDYKPSHWLELPTAPGDTAAPAEHSAQVDDLAQLVAKLAQALRKASPDEPLAAKAVDYLRRKRLLSPLRQRVEQPELIESVAQAIYEQWANQPGYVPWVPGGNSLKQGEARRIAATSIDATNPAPEQAEQQCPACEGKPSGENVPCAVCGAEPDTVKVPRELLERALFRNHVGHPDRVAARDGLRTLLEGGDTK